jgi:hypothetical protein
VDVAKRKKVDNRCRRMKICRERERSRAAAREARERERERERKK